MPTNQAIVLEKAYELYTKIQNATDENTKAELQLQFNKMTVEILKAGIVPWERYQESPEL